jgi:hypothetical protein
MGVRYRQSLQRLDLLRRELAAVLPRLIDAETEQVILSGPSRAAPRARPAISICSDTRTVCPGAFPPTPICVPTRSAH